MKLRIVSDLHLEGFLGVSPEKLIEGFIPHDDRDSESVLVLAGDISSNPWQVVNFIEVAVQKFQNVIYVPGNHEWYKQHIENWKEFINSKLTPLKNKGLLFSDGDVNVSVLGSPVVRFIYGTLWGDGGPTLADQAQVGFYLNDFRLIRHRPENRLFTTNDMIEVFKESKARIKSALEEPFEGSTVVITHHLPSRRLVSERFWPRDGSDGSNGGFVGNCDDLICMLEPSLWIHGHTHDTIDTQLWKTRIICNPAGYRGEWMSSFNTFMKPNEKGSREVVPVFVDV